MTPPFDVDLLVKMQLLTFKQQIELFRFEINAIYGDSQVASLQVNPLPSPFLHRPSYAVHFHNYQQEYSYVSAFNLMLNSGVSVTFTEPQCHRWPRKRARECFRTLIKSTPQVSKMMYRLDFVTLNVDIESSDAFRSSLMFSLLMIGLRLDNNWPALKLSDGSII